MSRRPAERFDWPGLMRAGLGQLRLDPKTFWSLTPGELELMLGKPSGFRPLKRARLEELLAAYPDDEREVEHG